MLMAVCHQEGKGWEEVKDLTELSELRKVHGNLLWAEGDISNVTEEDVQTIAEEFSLSLLAVEDALNARQRPKMEKYEHHLFLVFHQLDEIDGQLEPAQISCFIGERHVITLHAGAQRTLDEAKKRWESEKADLGEGTDYLIYVLLDVLVDDYQSIADRLEDQIEELEEIVLEHPTAPVQRQLYEVKQRTARIRRYAFPLERVLASLLDPGSAANIMEANHEFFRDVQDHVLRIQDQVRNIDSLADAAIDLRRAEEGRALNETTKKLTGYAAIIAVPTLITGVYGMNLGLFPPVGSVWGFWVVMGVILVETIFLFIWFKRRNWI